MAEGSVTLSLVCLCVLMPKLHMSMIPDNHSLAYMPQLALRLTL